MTYEIKNFRILIQNLDAFGNIIHYKYWNQSDEKWLEMYFNIHDTTASELERKVRTYSVFVRK